MSGHVLNIQYLPSIVSMLCTHTKILTKFWGFFLLITLQNKGLVKSASRKLFQYRQKQKSIFIPFSPIVRTLQVIECIFLMPNCK